jgi:hypothetical protein
MPSITYARIPNATVAATPAAITHAAMGSGFAIGAITIAPRVIFAMSQQNLARLSFCFSLRMRFTDWSLFRSIPVVKARQDVKAIPAAVNNALNCCVAV